VIDRDDTAVVREAYRRFNDRDVDAALALMTSDVVWPNTVEGGFVHGQDGVREHWRKVFATSEPSIDPEEISQDADGRVSARVRQVVTDKQGRLLADDRITHVFQTEGGRIQRMHVVTGP
jgi:ketosteroid isomerase-like protein